MPEYLHPGVYVQEESSGAKPIEAASTSTAAFVGEARRGRPNYPTFVSNLTQFERTFGGLDKTKAMPLAVRQFFQNGGQRAYIVRVLPSNAKPAKKDLTVGGFEKALTIEAIGGGAWGNDLKITILSNQFGRAAGIPDDPAAKPPLLPVLLDVLIEMKDADGKLVEVERFDSLGVREAGAKFYASLINRDSNYIRIKPDGDGNFPEATSAPEGSAEGALAGGTDKPGDAEDAAATAAAGKATAADAKLNENALAKAAADAKTAADAAKVEAKAKADAKTAADKAKADADAALADDPDNAEKKTAADAAKTAADAAKTAADTANTAKTAADTAKATADAAAAADPAVAKLREAAAAANAEAEKAAAAAEHKSPETNYEFSLQTLDRIDDVSILVIPGASSGMAAKGIAYVEGRKLRDMFYIIDTEQPGRDQPDDIQISNAKKFVEKITKTAYAAVYFPWVEVSDPYSSVSGATRFVPPSGMIAGLYARTDNTRGVWKAPAGTEASLLGTVGVSAQVTDGDQDVLNPIGLNCIRQFASSGIVVWGSRTLSTQSNPEYRYVPVRRTANFLKVSLYRGTQWVVFEPNDEPLWSSIRFNLNGFMSSLFRAGAFQGGKPADAYLVKCDADNNIQATIDQGQVHILVAFAPLKPAEFVIIHLQQMRKE